MVYLLMNCNLFGLDLRNETEEKFKKKTMEGKI